MPTPALIDLPADTIALSRDPHAIVSLRSANRRRCAKQFILQANGTIRVIPYDHENRWHLDVVPAATFAVMTEALELLSRCEDRIVVRGAVRDGVAVAPVLRRCVGAGAVFAPAPRAWVALDVDGLDLGAAWPGMAETQPTEALIAATVNCLPERFRRVACWWQLTSSYAVNTPVTHMRARLWFKLTHAVGDRAWKRVLRDTARACCIDLSLYSPVQPHFIARPTFSGLVDPIPSRTGIYDPAGARLTIDVSDIPDREEIDEGLAVVSALTRTGVDAHPTQVANVMERFRTRSRAASRHNTMVALIGELYGHGVSIEECSAYAGEWMVNEGRAPERGELDRAVLFVQRRAAEGSLRVNDTPISLLFDNEENTLELPPEVPQTPEEAQANQDITEAVTEEWSTNPNRCAYRALTELFGGYGFWRWLGADYEWTGTHWNKLPNEEAIGGRIQRASGLAPSMIDRAVKALRNDRNREWPSIPCRVEDGSAIAPRIVMKTGWLSVEQVRLLSGPWAVSAHDPRIFETVPPMPVAYDPTAQAPVFEQFMSECFAGDDESRLALTKLMGYLLFKGNEYQRIFICTGRPASGKSTWLRVMRALLGPERGAATDLRSFSTDFGLQEVFESTALFLPEASHGDSGSSLSGEAIDQLKRITGGDPVVVRRKFLSAVTVDAMPTPVIICNSPPTIRDEAVVRRLVTINFPHSFLGREDPTLTERLLRELPGILNIALRGLNMIAHQRDPFPPPAAPVDGADPSRSRELYEEIRADSSPVAEFVSDCLRPGDAPMIPSEELHAAYLRWCARRHLRPLEMRRFVSALRMCLHGSMQWTRRRLPDSGTRTYGVIGAIWAPDSTVFRTDASGF